MKTATKLSTKQKVMIGVGAAVILVGGFGLLNALGRARGFGFLPISPRSGTVKSAILPAYDETKWPKPTVRPIRTTTVKTPAISKKTK